MDQDRDALGRFYQGRGSRFAARWRFSFSISATTMREYIERRDAQPYLVVDSRSAPGSDERLGLHQDAGAPGARRSLAASNGNVIIANTSIARKGEAF